jgi:hypothetical protein
MQCQHAQAIQVATRCRYHLQPCSRSLPCRRLLASCHQSNANNRYTGRSRSVEEEKLMSTIMHTRSRHFCYFKWNINQTSNRFRFAMPFCWIIIIRLSHTGRHTLLRVPRNSEGAPIRDEARDFATTTFQKFATRNKENNGVNEEEMYSAQAASEAALVS